MKEHSAKQIPRGLADSKGEFAYVSGLGGLIYRLELASGDVSARSDFASTPLAIYQGALIGWRRSPDAHNVIRIFALAAGENTLSTMWEQTLALPAWVEVDSPEPEWFSLEAEIQDEELLFSWRARSRYPGGAPPPPGVEAEEQRDASGTVHIDLKSGRILREEPKAKALVPVRPLPQLPPNRRIVPYLRGEAWATQPWSINSEEAYLVRIPGDAGVWLVRRERGGAEGAVETRLTEDPRAEAAVTPDGEFVFIHEPRSNPPAWVVYSVKTGERVSKLLFEPGTGGVALVRDKVLYLVTEELGATRRSSLRCRDRVTGKALWSFTLAEETSMMAPPPPP